MSGLELTQVCIGRVPIDGIVRAVLHVEREMIDATTMAGVTTFDPRWETVDAAGHWHAAAVRRESAQPGGEVWFPTLIEHAEPNPRYDPDIGPDDDHWGCERPFLQWLMCTICRQRIVPRTITSHDRRYVAGPTLWRIEATIAAEQWWLPERAIEYVVRAVAGRRTAVLGPAHKTREYFGVAHWHPRGVNGGADVRTLVEGVFEGVSELGERVG